MDRFLAIGQAQNTRPCRLVDTKFLPQFYMPQKQIQRHTRILQGKSVPSRTREQATCNARTKGHKILQACCSPTTSIIVRAVPKSNACTVQKRVFHMQKRKHAFWCLYMHGAKDRYAPNMLGERGAVVWNLQERMSFERIIEILYCERQNFLISCYSSGKQRAEGHSCCKDGNNGSRHPLSQATAWKEQQKAC